MLSVPTAAANDIRQRNAIGRWYYPGMAVVMIAVAIAGFAPSIVNPSHRHAPLTPLVAVHGIVFSLWLVLYSLPMRGGLPKKISPSLAFPNGLTWSADDERLIYSLYTAGNGNLTSSLGAVSDSINPQAGISSICPVAGVATALWVIAVSIARPPGAIQERVQERATTRMTMRTPIERAAYIRNPPR
jgi:hypothetical protein